MPARSGQIQAGLTLDFPSSPRGGVAVLLEGANGQMPNLDFVNIVNRHLGTPLPLSLNS